MKIMLFLGVLACIAGCNMGVEVDVSGPDAGAYQVTDEYTIRHDKSCYEVEGSEPCQEREKVADFYGEKMPPVKKKPEKKGPTFATGPCYTGTVIIGEGKRRGRVELEGCSDEMEYYSIGKTDHETVPGRSTPPLVLKLDKNGRAKLPSAMFDPPSDDRYLVVKGKGVSLCVTVDTLRGDYVLRSESLAPYFRVNYYVKRYEKITPWIMPDVIGPPFSRQDTSCSKSVGCGRIFSMYPPCDQIVMAHNP